jgi:hypothetical protein
MGTDVGEENVRKMIQEADSNGDGRIDYHEFVAYWRSGVLKMRMKRLRGFAKRAGGVGATIRYMMNLAKVRQAARSNSHPSVVAEIVAPCARNPGDTYVGAEGLTTALAATLVESVHGIPSAGSSGGAVDSVVAYLPSGGTAVACTAYASPETHPDGQNRLLHLCLHVQLLFCSVNEEEADA